MWDHNESSFIASVCSILCHTMHCSVLILFVLRQICRPGWFARDPTILSQVGKVLLQLPEVYPVQPSRIFIADDCFNLLSIQSDRVTKPLTKSIENLFGRKFSLL